MGAPKLRRAITQGVKWIVNTLIDGIRLPASDGAHGFDAGARRAP